MIPQPSPRRANNRHKESKEKSPMAETELSDAKRAVRDLALKIEEANSRTKRLQRRPRWCDHDEPETSLKNNEDLRYAEVMKELEHVKQELGRLKIDMARVLKEKRHAERASKASNSKAFALSASMDLMKKEMEELNEEQAIVELAQIEAIKECESIESESCLFEAKKDVEDEESTRELRITLSDVNLLERELNMAKEMEAMARKQEGSMLITITDELEAAKQELASIKQEGFSFMTSMDVIRDELKHVREETVRLQKEEQKRDLNVQSLHSKILRAKAKLEALTAAGTKSNTIASNLSATLDQLRAESDTSKKEKDLIDDEIENMKTEIHKTESEIQLTEERLEVAMEELRTIKLSEAKALGNLRDVIKTTVEARDMASMNSSTITIANFEYEYLTGKAGGAAELADIKIAAAQAWVEALKANEREIMMKVEMTEKKISELSKQVEEGEEVEVEEYRRTPAEFRTKVVASPRRSGYRVGNVALVKRGRLQKLLSPAAGRYTSKSGSLRREKVMPKLGKLFSNKNIAMDE